ncbi:MAG: hypothetical protein KKA73_07130 [Chloroflexi bacterium]|nr:hypothetical protein [Chloroflexota bacterium]MBU1747443.1 hypothetical protein [Chloroflexota bacterium]
MMPLFIPDRRNLAPKRFVTNAQGQPIIPGSSLKGLVRGLVETIGPGCWWLFDGTYERGAADYRDKLPQEFQQCPRDGHLCVACRMFGLIRGGTLLLGHVGFEDAICEKPVAHDPIYTPILDAPKPHHTAWYLDSAGRQVAGRKFYFHSSEIRTSREIRRSRRGVELNQHITPIGPDSVFTFSGWFDNLAQDELALLLYALMLEPGMRHKIGYAKPAGLGSIEVRLTRLEFVDYGQRYATPDRGWTVYAGDELEHFMADQVAPHIASQSITLQDLRRIWAWPPAQDVRYGYPTRDWFNQHPRAPISATKDAPRQ